MKSLLRPCPPAARALLLWALTGLCCVAGCGPGVHQSAPVNADKARKTLKNTLEKWKAGETTVALQDEDPSITVQDFDWLGGAKLLEFDIQGAGQEVDANLVAEVKLKLEDRNGKKQEKTVTYLVTTAPALTVFRQDAP